MGLFGPNRSDGLPPPPAPVHRDANRWPLSDTAQQRAEPGRGKAGLFEALEQAVERAQREAVEEHSAADASPPEPLPRPAAAGKPARRRSAFGAVFLVVFALMALFVLVDVIEEGEWLAAVGPLIFLVFVAQGLWRRRRDQDDESGA